MIASCHHSHHPFLNPAKNVIFHLTECQQRQQYRESCTLNSVFHFTSQNQLNQLNAAMLRDKEFADKGTCWYCNSSRGYCWMINRGRFSPFADWSIADGSAADWSRDFFLPYTVSFTYLSVRLVKFELVSEKLLTSSIIQVLSILSINEW